MDAKRQHLLLFPSLFEFKSNEWQLFPRRLTELLRSSGTLTREETEEKRNLLKTAFPLWTKQDFFLFLYYCDQGKSTVNQVAAYMTHKTVEEISQYAEAMWSRGSEVFDAETWGKIKLFLNAQHADEIFEWQWNIKRKLVQLEHKSNTATQHHLLGCDVSLEEECFFLSAFLNRKSAQQVKQDIAMQPQFALDHYVRSETAQELEKSVEALIEVVTLRNEDSDPTATAMNDMAGGGEDEELREREAELREEMEWLERTLYPKGNNGGGLFSPLLSSSPHLKDDDGDSDGGNTISLDPRHHAQVLSVVLSLGTAGMGMLVNQVIKVLPEGSISKRQLKRDILCLAVKEKRAGDRAARWYARSDV